MLDEQDGRANCPLNHGLERFTVPSNTYRCDKCRNKMPKGSRAHGCRKCNYDRMYSIYHIMLFISVFTSWYINSMQVMLDW